MIPPWVAGFIGLPYAPGGRTRTGVDCWGLFALVWAEHFGRPIPPYEGPEWRPGADAKRVGAAAQAYADTEFRPVPVADAVEGDGILLRVRGAPTHVGIWVAPGFMLHIEERCGSVIDRYDGPLWRHRVLGFYRRR